MSTGTGNNDGQGAGQGSGKSSPSLALASVVTVVVLAAYLVAIAVLWDKVDSASETSWARWTFLLAGLEAPAFAAVGWLFGKEVHRARAEKAETEREKEAAVASMQQGRADRLEAAGGALRRALEASTPGDRLGSSSSGGTDVGTLQRIAEVFPRD